MNYRLLGNTGLKVSELCLGAMTFGGNVGIWAAIGNVQQEEVNALIKRSVEAGINFIDTANVYSAGLSEELTGNAIRQLGLKRDELVIATKVRGKMGEGPNGSDIKGPYIQGPAGARFIYLSWGVVDEAGSFTMLRRAKLWLEAVPSSVLHRAVGTGILVGRLALTDDGGHPLCASVRPPLIEWTAAAR